MWLLGPSTGDKRPSELQGYWWQVGADGCLCSGAANSFRKQVEAMEAGVVPLLAVHKWPCCSEQAAVLELFLTAPADTVTNSCLLRQK